MSKTAVAVQAHAEVPDYLKEEKAKATTGLDTSDFILPRIKLLQAMSPECRNVEGAKSGTFWHTGANKSLGTSFRFLPAVVAKRVILWEPTKSGTGGKVLAYSADGRNWAMGGNTTHNVTLKDGKTKATWNTKATVAQSKLLEWGSSDPSVESSPPAATLIYDYCCYLLDEPGLSPTMLGCYKTSINQAKKLNTALLMTNKPIQASIVECSALNMTSEGNTWSVPSFKLTGYAAKEQYLLAKEMGERYANHTADYQDAPEHVATHMDAPLMDEIKY
jgi:hypothetical protein